MANLTKKFGHRVYDLYAEYRTKVSAEHGARVARNKGFERVRVVKTGRTPARMDMEDYPWAVYVDVRSLNNPEQPAYQKGGVVHTRRIK